ncbi:MAG TPA: hypothetical protein VFE78_02470 [Gemmataceae bacterium]|nr:hypothetical protein [Gemmataceae bacterium]
MSNEDLLRMLDLAGKEAPAEAESLAVAPVEAGKKEVPASPTALRLDGWGLRRGADVLRASGRLRECLAPLGGQEAQERAAADFHGAAFEVEPTLNEGCADPLRLQFLRQLLDTPEYRGLHAATLLNEAASEIATAAFASQYAELRQERETDAKKEAASGGGTGKEEGRDFAEEVGVLRHVGKALAGASAEVEEARDAAAALGLGPGSPGSNDPKVIAALYRRARGDPTLRRVCELAGRYRRVAQSRQRRKAAHGLDDVVGVVTDGELSRLLPHELAKLAVPEFEDDTLRRLVERQTMCREYRATEPVAKGPIIVCVDESGSMHGEKGHTAKALALALAWVARHQKRWVALVAYSGDSGERLLPLPPGRWDEAALMDWLSEFIGRGSSLDVPVREMPRIYQELKAPAGKTDVLFVTDALCRIPADLQAQFRSWKQQVQARLISLVIDSPAGDLAALSDELHLVQSLAATEEGVGRALSI